MREARLYFISDTHCGSRNVCLLPRGETMRFQHRCGEAILAFPREVVWHPKTQTGANRAHSLRRINGMAA